MKKIFSLLVLLFVGTALMAQHTPLERAENAYKNQAYVEAIDYYKSAYSKEKNAQEKARIIFMIGECYLHIFEYEQAEVWFGKAMKAKYSDPVVYYRMAYALQNQGRYKEALRRYNQYFQKVDEDKLAELDKEACETAQKMGE